MTGAELTSFVVHRSLTPGDYAVYSTLLRECMSATTRTCVIEPATIPIEENRWFQSQAMTPEHQALRKALIDFKTTVTLNAAGFDSELKVVLATRDEIGDGINSSSINEFWDKFHQKYPQGRRIVLSSIAYGRSETEALVFASNYWGGRAGGSSFFILVNDHGHWNMRKEYLLSIS